MEKGAGEEMPRFENRYRGDGYWLVGWVRGGVCVHGCMHGCMGVVVLWWCCGDGVEGGRWKVESGKECSLGLVCQVHTYIRTYVLSRYSQYLL